MPRIAAWLAALAVALGYGRAAVDWRAAELGHSQLSAWSVPATLVVRDSGSFRSAWAQLYPVAGSRPALPAIDFSKWRVIVAAVGTKPTGGYFLTLERGQVVRDSALLTVTVHTPPAGCGVTEELTRPAIAIATPISPVRFRVVFHERADSSRCTGTL